MKKVICDVCGTDYPETAAQCPICGCARGDGGQTSAGNASEEEVQGYTYVKGGRFSKSNVRKRLKAQAQQAAVMEEELPKAVPQEPEDVRKSDDHVYEDEDEEYDDDDMVGVSNKGLILIVILLVLAIIAVSSYIAVTFFGNDDDPSPSQQTQQTTEATQPSVTEPVVTDPVVEGTPCTDLVLNDLAIELVNYNAPWELDFSVEPADTTDTVIFSSSDPSIATVDDNGVVKGVGNGEATITVSCGEFQAECRVICALVDLPDDPGLSTDPTDPDATTDPTQGTTEPVDPDLKLELYSDDITLSSKGASWQMHKGEVPRDQIQWSSDDETVATIEDGKVVAVGPGKTTIHAKYGDQELTCIVRCSFQEETEPTVTEPEPTEPEPTEPEPTEPEPTEPEPTESGETALRVNGNLPKYTYGDRENSADVSLVVGEEYKCVLSVDGADSVTWTSGDSSIATVEANGTIVPKGEGRTTLTATVDGVEYIVMVRVSES